MAVRQQQRRGTAAQWAGANPILAAAEIGFEIDTNKFKIGDGVNRWDDLTYFTADAAAAINDLIDGAPGLLDTLNELAAAVGDDANFFSTVTTNIATAKSEAISTAATDATTKANNAKSGAESTAATALSNHASDTTNIHGIANTANLVTQSDLTNAISGATVNQSSLAGVGLDWNSIDERFDIDSTVATKTYVDDAASNAIAAVVDSAPAALDTLKELADALTADESTAATLATLVGTKASSSQVATDIAAEATARNTAIATAKSEAISTAASDATTKANNAKSGAETTAANALASHESDTTNIHGIADTSVLATATTVATAKSEAIATAGNAADTKVSNAVAALTKSSVGLSNVDNTSDANKPVSTATQTALDLKAPLASPEFTGNPTAPTQTVGNDSTRVATTAFVKAAIQDISSLNLVLDGGGV